MTLFIKPKNGGTITPLTTDEKVKVYAGLKKNETFLQIKQDINHANGASFAKTMRSDISSFESQVNVIMSGKVVVTPAEYIDGELTKVIVYNTSPATLEALKKCVFDLGCMDKVKTVSDLVDDVVEYATKVGTWEAYKELF